MKSVLEAVDFINAKTNKFRPTIGIVLGSGLGELADNLEGIRIPYNQIPGFQESTVAGHSGQLVFAEFEKHNVVLMQGRFHHYEGHSLEKVTFPIKVMKKLGVEVIILTNAAGGCHPEMAAGDLMLITDHINFMCSNPLMGPNDEDFGERFPDMSEVYDKKLIALAQDCANELGIDLERGVYLAVTGPNYETPAEIKMFRQLGADAVGMSTVPEAIVANYCKMRVLGISLISNSASGIASEPLCHESVIATAQDARHKFKALIKNIVSKIKIS